MVSDNRTYRTPTYLDPELSVRAYRRYLDPETARPPAAPAVETVPWRPDPEANARLADLRARVEAWLVRRLGARLRRRYAQRDLGPGP
jgi:hypothetical protein